MLRFVFGISAVMASAAFAAPPDSALRPVGRPNVVLAAAHQGFDAWIAGFRSRAMAAGIRAATFDRAFSGVRYNATVIERDRNQSEFTKTLWDYLDTAVSDSRIRNGQSALRRQASVLDQIESYYGVDKEIVAAVWGLESAYGAVRGDIPIIEALATLAYDTRRGRFFESQLIDALKILQSGDVRPRDMVGSWAGAMGHTQFIPSSYLRFAVDANGDGKRDIWSDDPTDALASTAAYLARNGWVKGMPWGVEVRLPNGFDYRMARRDLVKMPSEWAQMGVTGIDGRPVRDFGSASVLVPAGAQGAAFLIFKNFKVIESYNTADSYVIAVGHLADRLRGGPAIQSSWPRGDRALTYAERRELQDRLTRAGHSTQGVDGKMGPLTINAIRNWQDANGQIPDGYPSLRLLQQLR